MQFINLADKLTHNIKMGAGYVHGFTVSAAGTSWTIQIFDAVPGATTNPIIGATAMAMPAAGTFVKLDCHFTNGLQVVLGGTTAGELVLMWN